VRGEPEAFAAFADWIGRELGGARSCRAHAVYFSL
jgi:hypothetical protein